MHTSNLANALLIALLPFAHAVLHHPEPDYHIICYGPPPGAIVHWPRGRSPDDYPDNSHLCSPQYEAQYQLGCKCTTPTGPLDCSLANGADPVLFGASFFTSYFGYHSFLEYCQNACQCVAETEEEEFDNSSPSQQAESLSGVEDPDSETPGALTPAETEGTLQDTAFSSLGGPGGGLSSRPSWDFLGCQNVSCAIGSACRGSNCGCKLQSSRWEPSTGVIEYTGLCSALSRRKRDIGKSVEEECLCNSTYASAACCDAKDSGLVWEVPE
ncbi:MAG: hypothetical protein M1828_001999 [Chrysothrix sp. TS-e1954]|nr:MAG: hypothetical protein M1828_001999 [Chrysothrix sp. TS-e1954]